MNFYEKLKLEHGTNKPIVIEDLCDWNYTNESIRKQLSNLAKEGKVIRYIHGVYYIPEEETSVDNGLDVEDVLEYKYIRNGKNVMGFYLGYRLEKELGLPYKPDTSHEIITNREKTRKRPIEIEGIPAIIRKPYLVITERNYKLVQLLYYIKKSTFKSLENHYQILRDYVMKNKFTRKDLLVTTEKFPKAVLNKVIDSGLLKDFLS
ncbi:conserved hypothetical protein [Alteracholeplasma palmae J233]|uniref:Transcriptional regulator, AbiEi antitoxin, Type IV TA system n=1 Tax=Alteracholeplasma palmae (strain ATCC 49389 / J233) TaxID=1318466 RepID=U4KJL5_ALTPJ|nr:hypothetical protein [Alteracholeplasma palmae]CCV63592.1 conserved hypothetical protein [Alteracholeplasma palmae J233]